MAPETQRLVTPDPADPLSTWEEFAEVAKLANTPAGNRALREASENPDLAAEIRELIEKYRAMVVITQPWDGQKVLVNPSVVNQTRTAMEMSADGETPRDLTKEYYRRGRTTPKGGTVARNFSFGTLTSPQQRGRSPRRDPEASKIITGTKPLDAEPRARVGQDPELDRIKAALLNGAIISGDSGL